MRSCWLGLVVVLGIAACDCGDDPPARDAGAPDSGARDAGFDAGGTTPINAGTSIFPSSGGGEASSPSFRLRLTVGGPQPIGEAESPSRMVVTGPTASGR
jgi:hypothetical protein